MSSPMQARMQKEISMLTNDPPYGICAWPKEERLDLLEAQIQGPEGSPYEGGIFHLELNIPQRYPFEPPKVRFLTPIYHPNIDNGGRICLDTLKMPPKGSWVPSVNLSTLLTTIRLLMAEPNPEDGLMSDITDLFKQNHSLFLKRAKQTTEKHAKATSLVVVNEKADEKQDVEQFEAKEDNETHLDSDGSSSCISCSDSEDEEESKAEQPRKKLRVD